MATRLELQSKLEELLDSENVYYRPPTSMSLSYPCIVYKKSDIKSTYANNTAYLLADEYTITVISKTPDHPVIKSILALPTASYDRPYVSDNLNHDVITLYY